MEKTHKNKEKIDLVAKVLIDELANRGIVSYIPLNLDFAVETYNKIGKILAGSRQIKLRHKWKPTGSDPVDEGVLECERCGLLADKSEVRRGGLGKCEIQIIYMKPGEEKTITLDRNTQVFVTYPEPLELQGQDQRGRSVHGKQIELNLTSGTYQLKMGNVERTIW